MPPKSPQDVQAIAIAFGAVSLGLAASLVAVNSLRINTASTGPVTVNVHGNTDSSPPVAPSETIKEKDKKVDDQLYEVKRQYMNSMTSMWTDLDENSPEDSKAQFTVRVRGQDSDDQQPTTMIILRSEDIRLVLHEVIKECENLSDVCPTFEVEHLYHRWDDLLKQVELKKKQLAALEKGASAEEAAIVPVEGAIDAQANKGESPKTIRLKKYSKEALQAQVEGMKAIFSFLDKHYKETKDTCLRLAKSNSITYKLLWTIFQNNRYISSKDEDSQQPIGLQTKTTSYEESHVAGKYFNISAQFIEWNGESFVRRWKEIRIKRFKGQRRIAALDAQPMSDERMKELTKRGKMYCDFAKVAYVSYTGELIQVSANPMGKKVVTKARADGRVMLTIPMRIIRMIEPLPSDRVSYRQMCPNGWGNSDDCLDECTCSSCMVSQQIDLEKGRQDEEDDQDGADDTAEPEPSHGNQVLKRELCLLPATHYGFSFKLREWGQLTLSFSDIKFDEQAYDHLVLEQRTKDLIRSLVEATHKETGDQGLLTDVITGKGGGCVLVLHGTPGTGKTLTAESVAELLKRPLYSVSSGQLGTDAVKLEENLKHTLDLAQRWECCLLIDEADVFLEARSEQALIRNGMVAVFLRLLESFSGVLFLTTNRVTSFDDAFISRFSVAIKYSELDRNSRMLVWRKFLAMTGVAIGSQKTNGLVTGDIHDAVEEPKKKIPRGGVITEKELGKLVDHEINGRVIKQIVRAAQALSFSQKTPLSYEHISVVLKLQQEFEKDFKGPAEIDYTPKDKTWSERTNLYQ